MVSALVAEGAIVVVVAYISDRGILWAMIDQAEAVAFMFTLFAGLLLHTRLSVCY